MHISSKICNHAILASIAAIAFIVACVSHEVIGHGGTCLTGGGHITWLSSVYFHCSNGGPFGAAAGPTANLVVGTFCWWLLQARPSAPSVRLLLVLTMAFNLFWGAAYFIFSAIADTGDWAWFLHDFALEPLWLWRSVMGVLGVFIYMRSVRLVSKNWPAGASSIVPYFAAGVVATVATLFYFGAILPALREAVEESFVAGVGLLSLTTRGRSHISTTAKQPASQNNYWILLAVVLVVIFWLTLGKGFGTPGPG